MTKLLVEDTSLVSVADAIRTKGGTTDALTFPDGFVSAIEGIQSGGGDDGAFVSLVDGSITEITADMLKGCAGIRDYAFYYCRYVTKITIPESVTSIGNAAFFQCYNLANINIPDGIVTIATNTFCHCDNLASINIPDSVQKINSYAFQYSALGSIVIPNNVSGIYTSAFESCTKLTTVIMRPTTPPTLGTNVFRYCNALTTIIVPAGSLSAYQSATNWSTYADLMVEASS